MNVLKEVETRMEGLNTFGYGKNKATELKRNDEELLKLTSEVLFRRDIRELDYEYSEEERKSLFEEYFATRDPEIKKKLLESNIGLLLFFANKFNTNLPFLDLVQQGYFALDKAIDTFDPEKGKFSTYAGTAIYREMAGGVYDQSRVIPFPHYVYGNIRKVLEVKDSYYKANGCFPSYEKIIASLEGFDEKKLFELMLNTRDVYSLYERIGENEDDILANYVFDSSAKTDTDAINAILCEEIIEGLSDLSEKQGRVIRLMLGLETGTPMIKQQVADYLDISHQRVCQLYDGAIKNLKKRKNFQIDDEWHPRRYTVTKTESIRYFLKDVIDHLNSNGIMTSNEIRILKLVLGYDGKICSVTKLCREHGYSVSQVEDLLERFNEYKKSFVKIRKG